MATQYGVTRQGFVRKPISVILSSLNSKFVAAFGKNFDVSPESPDGQIIGIVADEISECWNQAQLSYNAYRPGATEGIGLDNICELSNTKRYVDKPSRVTILCEGSTDVTVPAGSIVGDGTMEFTVQDDVQLPGDVTAVANEIGEYYVAANTVTKIITPVEGWTSVNNPEIGQTGINYESDPELRARRDRTTARNGAAFVESMYAALADLDLPYVRIRDNDTGAAIGSQPAGTIFVVVDGGTENDIARRIYQTKTGGVPMHGDIEVELRDSKGYPKFIKFSRSTRQEIYVSGTFRRRAGANISANDAAQMLQEAMIEYINNLSPGESVVWSALFAPLMSATTNLEIDSLFIGLSANPTGMATIELDIDKRALATKDTVTFKDVTQGY